MRKARTLALALPGAVAVALWGGYRHAVNEFQAHRPPPPRLPGHVRSITTYWGRLCYRVIEGPGRETPLVLIHGWGRSADAAWWPLMEHTKRTVIAVDLPGHGRSTLDERFSFELAADSVALAVEDAGLHDPILVGHSMGGPISLLTLRASPRKFSGLVAIASSAYWVSPHLQVIVAAAPYLFAPRSPIVTAAMRQETRRSPGSRMEVTRSYGLRPSRRVLGEAAMELRGFDARMWEGFDTPPIVWAVTNNDGVINPADQVASGHHFEARVVGLDADHSVIMTHPRELMATIESLTRVPNDRPRLEVVRSAAPHSMRAHNPGAALD